MLDDTPSAGLEGVVDALQSDQRPQRAFAGRGWDYGHDYEDDYDRELR